VNWTVRIDPRVRQDINSWPISRNLRVQVYNRLLIDLPGNPDGLLGEQIVPLMARAYPFTLVDDGPIAYRIHFMFAVDRRDDLSELHVLGARMTTEDTGEG
jgi:hypothetical protein